jgi:tellurite resistance protein
MKLSKDVFLALTAVAWADGVVSAKEADVLERAAKAAGLIGADLDAVQKAIRSHEVARKTAKATLSAEEGEFVYAVACLLSASDGDVAEEEREAIATLADRLRIPFDVRAKAAAASVAVGKALGVGPDALDALARELSRT